MALLVDIEGDTGAVARYWRVIEVNMNYFAGVGSIALAGYITKVARNAGKRPIDAKQFPLQGTVFDDFTAQALSAEGENPVRKAYLFIKNYTPAEGQPPNPFTTATDD